MALQRLRRTRRDVTPDVVDQCSSRNKFAARHNSAASSSRRTDPPTRTTRSASSRTQRPQHAEPHGDINTPAAPGSKAALVALQPSCNRATPELQPRTSTVGSPDNAQEADMYAHRTNPHPTERPSMTVRRLTQSRSDASHRSAQRARHRRRIAAAAAAAAVAVAGAAYTTAEAATPTVSPIRRASASGSTTVTTTRATSATAAAVTCLTAALRTRPMTASGSTTVTTTRATSATAAAVTSRTSRPADRARRTQNHLQHNDA